MALVFNADGIKNQVKPDIMKNKKHLNLAKEIAFSIDIPNDFAYYSQLKKFPSEIYNIEQKANNINRWLDESINNFENADKKSAKAMEQVLASVPNLKSVLSKTKVVSSNLSKTGAKVKAISKSTIDNFVSKTQKTVSSAVNYVTTGNWILTPMKLAKKTASNVATTVKSGISSAVTTGAKICKNVTSTISKTISSSINFVGAKISSALKWTHQNIVKPVGNLIKATGASIANVVIGVVKGLAQLIESLLDLIIILGTGIDSIFTGAYDGATYLISSINGNTKDWKSYTSHMWKSTMSYVAEDHVGNAFSSFYKNNIIGKWLDENAGKPFKSDGIATNIASGLGYVAGIIALTVATAGIAGAATASGTTFTTIGAGIATASGTGKYTAEYWGKMRDSSWEGIERLYENGQISEEQMNSYKMIRSLTDQQWKDIQEDCKNGKISEEEYKQMEQIRNMPDDWTTLENGLKGFGYGVANGVWEGIQWYVGGKLAGTVISESSKVVN